MRLQKIKDLEQITNIQNGDLSTQASQDNLNDNLMIKVNSKILDMKDTNINSIKDPL